ncbi:hypothetical protein EV426DRAFT_615082 [Tirmania nivea]|nr:hypothetical protein EV426DRAFT_615082 [Tirmania nivea]
MPTVEVVMPAVQEEEARTPAVEEILVEYPPVEHAIVEEPVAEPPTTPAHVQEEVPTPTVEVVMPAVQEEEARTPAVEEILVEHAIMEEPVAELPTTPAHAQEEVPTPIVEVVMPAVQEGARAPAIDEISVEHAIVEEPATETLTTPAPLQEEVSTPVLEVISVEEPPVERSLVQEPVTETPATDEEISTVAIEEVHLEQPPVEHASTEEPVTEAPPIPASEKDELSTPAVEEVLVENPPVEHALVVEPVTRPPTPTPEQEEVRTPAVEVLPVGESLVEHPPVEEPETDALLSPTPEQEEISLLIIPPIEGPVEQTAVEQAFVEEPVIEIPVLVNEQEQISTPTIGEVLTEEPVTEIPASVDEQEQVSAPTIENVPVENPPVEAPLVEELVTVAVTPTVEEEQAPALISESLVQEPIVERAIQVEKPETEQGSPAEGAATDGSILEASEPILATEVQSVEGDIVQLAADVPEIQVLREELVEIAEPVPEPNVLNSANVEDESAPEAATEDAEVEHISESSVDVSAPVEVPSIFGGDVPSTKEVETELPLAPGAYSMDKEGVPEETVADNIPVEETAQEQRDFDAELAIAKALLSHPVSDISPADKVIPQTPSEEQQPIEALNKTSTEIPEIPEIPALFVTKTDENHGDDFGVDATTSQKDAHELLKADAEPDEDITPPEPEAPSIATEGIVVGVVEDTGKGASDDEFELISHADAVPDEQELTHGECATAQEPRMELPESITPIPVACETAAAVADSAITVDPIDRSTVSTPIPVAAEIAAAVEDTAAQLDPTDRSAVPTPISVAAETAAAVEDTAATLDVCEARSKAPTPIPEAAETAAAVEDIAAILDPTDCSAVPTPIPLAAESAAAVEDTAATLDTDERDLEVSPISEAAETAAAVGDTTVSLDTPERPTVSIPIAEVAEAVAAIEDTAATLNVDGDYSTAITPIPQASDVAAEVANVSKELDLVSEPEAATELPQEEAQDSFRDTRPTSPLPATRAMVADSITPVDVEAEPTEAATPVPSPMAEAPITLEVEAADTTKIAEELDTESAVPLSAIPREPTIDSPDYVAITASIVHAPKVEVVEATGEAAPVPQVILEEDAKSNDGLSDNLLIAGSVLAGTALIEGGIYAVTRNDKNEGVPMARTITNESSKSVHDKPLSFNGDHILPHMKEVGPQVAETEVHRAEIVRPTSNVLSKSVDAPAHDNEILDHEPCKDVDPAFKDQLTEDQLTEGQWLAQSHEPGSISKSESAHTSKGKGPETFPEPIEEDDFVELFESSGHLQAPRMQRDPSGSSEFAESLISVDAISEALRYMRENNSEAAFRPPNIVVSEETTDGEHRTRNIVEVITPDTELITEPEPRRKDPSTRREQSRPSTRGSDMVSATHHKNLMENFWKLVFVGWLGGMGKFFVGLFGRKNGEQLGSVYANYAASMRESQLISQQNLNFEQHMGGSAKNKEKEKVRGGPREEEMKTKNGVNGNGVSASNGVSGNGVSALALNGASGMKVKESRRGSIKKKWNAYRKKGD